jgi:hypothetical protein
LHKYITYWNQIFFEVFFHTLVKEKRGENMNVKTLKGWPFEPFDIVPNGIEDGMGPGTPG